MRMKLRMLRTDRGGKFTSNEFTKYCKENGIARQLTAPYSPQQNGVVERRNRTVVPIRSLVDKTPYEALYNRKPNLENLRIFGYTAYTKITIPHLKKLDDRSIPMVYLGVEEGSKACSTQDIFWASFVVEGVDNENPTPVNTENNDNTYQEEQEPITDSPITPPAYTYNPNSEEEEEATISSLRNSKNQFDDTPVRGFIQQGNSKKIYKLTKALYGLRQAPRAWNVKLDQTLKTLDFKKCNLEQAVYTKKSKTYTLIVGVYVDDLIITGTTRKEIDLFKSQMKDKFEMSDLRLLAYYRGIEITQTRGEITIKQSGYINKILKETSMMDSNDTKIPMDPGTKLVKAEDGNSVDATDYRSLIRSLRYLLHTRPDLSYSVGLLSRFMQDPKDHHLKAIKQVIRYIKGTKEHDIIYKKDGSCKITGYNDSSYGINTDQGKGTTGIVFYFGESPITWCTQKQPTVALSSCESEFMVATGAACQALWLKRILSELTGWEEKRITLKVDNISAIALVRNPVFHGRSKHIDTRYHFIRECIENGHINVEHVSGELQRADIVTKALPRLKFVTMRQMLGVQDLGRSNDQD
ncbi:zinc finger, CCHC-type containing protein [Tanacetum coccineum]